MKPKPMLEFIPSFPEGTELHVLEAPAGLEQVVGSCEFALMPDGTYTTVLEFDNHEEWQEFKKNRLLLIMFMDIPCPFAIGAFHVGTPEGKEDSLLELQSEDSRKKN